jgi:hypothetical protein
MGTPQVGSEGLMECVAWNFCIWLIYSGLLMPGILIKWELLEVYGHSKFLQFIWGATLPMEKHCKFLVMMLINFYAYLLLSKVGAFRTYTAARSTDSTFMFFVGQVL